MLVKKLILTLVHKVKISINNFIYLIHNFIFQYLLLI